MIRLSRIWKLYITYTTALIVCMTLAGFFLDFQVRRQLENHLKEDALATARIADAHLPNDNRPEVLSRFCRSYREVADWRLTIVASDGTVMADSHEQVAQMNNHRDRIEIQAAMANGHGTAVHMSPTLGREMLYAAIYDPQRGIVVRVAMPMSSVKGVQNEVMKLASVFLYLAPLACAIISFFAARSLVGENTSRLNVKHQ